MSLPLLKSRSASLHAMTTQHVKFWFSNPTDNLTLKHEIYAIWSACSIPGGYITCGADRTIRIWSDKGGHIYTQQAAHETPIRGCLFIKEKQILATIDNSCELKEWQVNFFLSKRSKKIYLGRIPSKSGK
ncbi:hypothetical protein M9Y10_037118 [Tritrichomonas musculus]|uniref:Uncharacterized protein n=1 Tax=Tritrichomonas musculus TaxID=1915356 RepID=A0ABR2GT05_9EUKA